MKHLVLMTLCAIVQVPFIVLGWNVYMLNGIAFGAIVVMTYDVWEVRRRGR